MIRAIVAMDDKKGIATNHGIPWDLPSDRAFVRQKTWGGVLFMGFGTYKEFKKPLPGRRNLVLTHNPEVIRPGFEPVSDLEKTIDNPPENLWIFGGQTIFEQTLDVIDEIYLTQVIGDFKCTKFFPKYQEKFKRESQSDPKLENDTQFRFEKWVKK